MKSVSLRKVILIVVLTAIFLLPTGCSSFSTEQPGETAAEGKRRHLRVDRLNNGGFWADVDAFFQIDEPSRLSDKRIP